MTSLQPRRIACLILLLVVAVAGAASSLAEEQQQQRLAPSFQREVLPVALEVTPGESILKPGESRTLQVLAREADGSTRDVTWLAQFFSNDEALVRVTPAGLVTARAYGEASVRIHFLNLVQVVRFTIPFPNEVPAVVAADRRNAIDGPVFDKLRVLRLPPAEDCSDAEFVRRAFLDTIGVLGVITTRWSASPRTIFTTSPRFLGKPLWIARTRSRAAPDCWCRRAKSKNSTSRSPTLYLLPSPGKTQGRAGLDLVRRAVERWQAR